jgi:preprotein translocase subunit SecA
MLKNIIFNNCQRKINKLKPKVDIQLNKEIPTPSLKELSGLTPIVSKVNSYEKELENKPDIFFKDKSSEYKELIASRTKGLSGDEYKQVQSKVIEEMLPFYFAMIREAAKRTVKMRHFDVQILGGIVLHRNRIAEMVTGEGKTIVATLAASLNALTTKGVHIITVNDYLAKRDKEWMGPIYEFLGLSCGVIQQDMEKGQRKAAYSCDIAYGTNNEFGFDYLRDNMATSCEAMVQRDPFYAIVDEVDSILIDEARTPLIISGPAESYVKKYYLADKAVSQMRIKVIIQSSDNKDGTVTVKSTDGSEVTIAPEELDDKYDAIIEEKANNAYFTSGGENKCEKSLGVKSLSSESPDNLSNPWIHYLTQSLKARHLFKADREYIVKEGKVVIVDEFTGRLMSGRRWSDGLHQAVEAKEGLTIQEETQTLATITLQNYFKMYDKLAGMTGTAYTEANEFNHIYKLDVVVVPTNQPLIRMNCPDRIYKNQKGKFKAVVDEIREAYEVKRPVLVGTISIEDSEQLSFLLNKGGIEHNILNAKYHEKEAHIVAQAGRLGQITIATNMAGRGTDIILGGNLDYFIKDILSKNNISVDDSTYKPEYEQLYLRHKDKFQKGHDKVVELGGLHIIGTQRHEARRIDNQLRGRAGRQGDPGSSRFYVSTEDDLMRLFGSERIYSLMERFNFPEDQPIEHMILNHSLAVAQKRVEGHNFEIRKQLLQFDNIMNKQREVIYRQRRQILESSDFKHEIFSMIDDVLNKNIPFYFQEEKDIFGLTHWLKSKFDLEFTNQDLNSLALEEATELIKERINAAYQKKEQASDPQSIRQMERMVALWVVDSRWKEHLLTLDHLREGIHLRAHAQVDPLVAYQKESYFAFEEMISSIKQGIVDLIFKAQAKPAEKEPAVFADSPKQFVHPKYSSLNKEKDQPPLKPQQPQQSKVSKVGRNQPCPCGSGKKYKKCCGK